MNFSYQNECNQLRTLNQMDQEEVQEALILGVSYEDDHRGGRGGCDGAATKAEAGTEGVSERAVVMGTEVALALTRWTPGVTTDRIAGRGHICLALQVLKQLFFYTQHYSHYSDLSISEHPWVFYV